jgi:hypothetical protein
MTKVNVTMLRRWTRRATQHPPPDPHGSTADEIATAQTHAVRAHPCAQRAHLRAAERDDQAVDAHLRLAV